DLAKKLSYGVILRITYIASRNFELDALPVVDVNTLCVASKVVPKFLRQYGDPAMIDGVIGYLGKIGSESEAVVRDKSAVRFMPKYCLNERYRS
ncbi:MAG: hypothetical protein Q8J78_16365, partial [Moraxellaceae bacterium]|nr:hypothetical protein [Moraxellaceae bacterium]